MARLRLPVCAALLLLLSMPAGALASNEPTTTWTTNGTVNATLVHGSAVYVGGSFTAVGPHTGGGVVVDGTTGDFNAAASPEVAGSVKAVVPDGAGGWYVGGSFSGIGTTAISGLAHIASDGSVDESFEPQVSGVSALAVDGDTVYVGTASAVTAFDHDGLARWSTPADGGVGHLVVSGGTLYAAGHFGQIGGQNRTRLAALDAATGAVTAWSPAPSGGIPFGPSINDLAVNGGVVYVAGEFTAIGAQSRAGLAAIGASGAATAWNPAPVGAVNALGVAGGTLFAAGSFTQIGGQPRNGLAAVNPSTGTATAWHPAGPPAGESIGALAATASQVFVAGSDPASPYLAAFDATTGIASGWAPRPGGTVGVLAASGNRVYLGGQFTSINTVLRRNAAAFDLATGQATTWNPNVDTGGFTGVPAVSALAASGTTVYLGGHFATVGGSARSGLAAVDDTTGALASWNPGATYGLADVGVDALLVDGSLLYAGGQFSQLGGQSRSDIAAVDRTTAAAASWNPNATGGLVRTLLKVGSSYVAGGDFTAIGGQPRMGLAALDAAGVATAWNPGTNGTVRALAASGSTIYVGGTFTTLAGQNRGQFGAVDAVTGAATSLALPIIGEPPTVDALAQSGGRLYLGGAFLLGAAQVPALAELDTTTGTLTTFFPNRYGVIRSLATSGTALLVGGSDLSSSHGDTDGDPGVDGFASFAPTAPDPAPIPFRLPKVIGLLDAPLADGVTAVCDAAGDDFFNRPTSVAYRWSRDGAVIPGATTNQHAITAADSGHLLRCTVVGANAAGSHGATSPARRVGAGSADTTPPTITITTPADGQHFALGQAVTPVYGCADGSGSGIASCTAVVIDTGSTGSKTFAVSAVDLAGNPASASVSYVVDAAIPPPNVPPPPGVAPPPPPAPPGAALFMLRSSVIHVGRVRRSAKQVVATITGLPKGTAVRGRLIGKKALSTARATSTGRTTKLTFKLTRKARRALKSKQLKRLQVLVTATLPRGAASTATASASLK